MHNSKKPIKAQANQAIALDQLSFCYCIFLRTREVI